MKEIGLSSNSANDDFRLFMEIMKKSQVFGVTHSHIL